MLVGAPWLTDGSYDLTTEDYLHSMLCEGPDEFYITPSEQVVFIFVPGRGLIRIQHNFVGYSDEQINEVISAVLGSDS